MEPGKPAWKRIKDTFGEEILLEDGRLNREELGRQVFSDETKRKQLNAITHPEIRKTMFWEIIFCFLKGLSSFTLYHWFFCKKTKNKKKNC